MRAHIHCGPCVSGWPSRLWLLFIGALCLLSPSAPAADDNTAGTTGRWAILVGVDDYASLTDLEYCGQDQLALRDQLVACGFPEDQVFLLHDAAEQVQYKPFKNNVEKQLRLVLGLLEPGDLVVVAFSGHGVLLDGQASYLCPNDADLERPAETMVALDSVYAQLQESQATLKLMMIDACRNDPRPPGKRSARNPGEANQGFVEALAVPPQGILLLTSCAPGESAAEDPELKHGVFMYQVLQGLQGKADRDTNGWISLTELYQFANLETKKHVARVFNDSQRPGLKGDLTDDFELAIVGTTLGGKPGDVIANTIGMKLVLIRAGDFLMGSTPEQVTKVVALDPGFNREFADSEQPQHRVTITKPFYLGQYEVTVGEFRRFVSAQNYRTGAERDGEGGSGWNESTGTFEGPDPKYNWQNTGFTQTDDHPVVNVSWNDATAFCEWLSQKEGQEYRLPTEAEWEYACRGGATGLWHHGDNLNVLVRIANVSDATAKAKWTNYPDFASITARDGSIFTSRVGSYEPNKFGLYDLHGNVREWCADWYDPTAYRGREGTYRDPFVESGERTARVLRGGSWDVIAGSTRSAHRDGNTPDDRTAFIGFRLARTP